MPARDIDEVVLLLDRQIATYLDRRSPLAYFAALYRAITIRVRRGIELGTFEDGPRMDRFDTAFGNRYFAALDAVADGREPAKSWRVAFGAESRPCTAILQHILLGVNAHINFDLPFAAVAAAPGASLPGLWNDYDAINRIIAETYDEVQTLIGRFSPLLHVLDHVGGNTDEAVVNFSIVAARDEAWHEATRLARESGASIERATRSLDRRAALVGDRLILPGGPIGLALQLIADTESRDVIAVAEALIAFA
ncbi:MAG TPA: DUF5995 family protein [Polyangiaceae bacterium]|nr:DUF5995 family protein [Polyangiaceae bacterium]